MNDEKKAEWSRRFERSAYGALWAFLLAPVIAHGLWRPLLHFFGPSGRAGAVTLSGLAVSGTIVVARELRQSQAPLLSLALGGLVAVGASVGFSLGLPGVLTLLSVAAAIAFLLPRLSERLPNTLDGLARRHKLLFALYFMLALAAVIKTAQLSIFIGGPHPGYVTIGLLWAITLLSASVQSLRGGISLVLLLLLLTVFPPISNLKLFAVYSILQSALTLGVPIWLIVHAARQPLSAAKEV